MTQSPRDALRRHGLKRANDRPATPDPPRESARRPSEADLERYRQRLEAGTEALARLVALRGWAPEAIRWLGRGVDSGRVGFPVRDSHSALVNLLRYEPDPDRRTDAPKLLAESGCPRDLFPAPETL